MSSTEILKWFMVVAFFVLIITNLSAVAESDDNHKKHYADQAKMPEKVKSMGQIKTDQAIKNKNIKN